MANLTDLIKSLPNSISGDGSTWIALLKKAMGYLGDSIDSAISDSTKSVSNVTNIALSQEENANEQGYPRIDLIATWDSSNVDKYSGADIYTRIGSSGSFEYDGSTNTNTYTKTSVKSNTVVYVKVLAKNSTGNVADINNAPMASITISGSVETPIAPSQFSVTWTNGQPLWQWTSVNEQSNFDYYELREDTNVGMFKGMLDTTTSLSSDVEPSQRAGVVYLFVRNVFGNYSYPVVKQYNKAVPNKPNVPTVEELLLGLKITTDLIPTECTGVELSFLNTSTQEEQIYQTENNVFTFYAGTGTWEIKYRFYDKNGGGEFSDTITKQVLSQIGESQIADNAITVNKINANAVTADKINANAVTADKINANAVTTDKLEANAVTADKILAGAITAEKIASQSITTAKLATQDIDMTGALAIVGGNVRLSEEGLRLTGNDSSYTLFNGDGINYVDVNGITYAQVKKMIIGSANDGQYIRFKAPWAKAPSVMCSPMGIRISDANYASTNLQLICEPTNLTENGFNVSCYLRLQSGSNATVNANASGSIQSGSVTNRVYNGYYYSYNYRYYLYGQTSNVISLSIPNTAGYVSLSCSLNIARVYSGEVDGGNNGAWTQQGSEHSITIVLKDGSGNRIATTTFSDDGAKNLTLAGYVTSQTALYVCFEYYSYINVRERGSIETIYGYDSQIVGELYKGTTVEVPTFYYSVTGDAKIATGSAMFVVTDGSTNTYTIE